MEETECSTQTADGSIHGQTIKDLRFADDVDIISATEDGLQLLVAMLAKDSTEYGLQTSRKKLKLWSSSMA